MKIYYLVVDYCGWCVFQTLDGTFPFTFEHEPYYFSTTCLDVANKMRKILHDRGKY